MACFLTLTLSKGSILAFSLSGATVAPAFVFYVALLPKSCSRPRYLPHVDNLEDAVRRLSWKIVTLLVLALGGKTLVYGVTFDTAVHTLGLGLLQACSWYFVSRMTRTRQCQWGIDDHRPQSRIASWCIAPAMATFGLVATRMTSTSTNAQALSVILASALAIAQILAILPQSAKGKSWLWGFLLFPLTAYLFSAWQVRNAQSTTQSSFSHDLHHPIEVLMDNAKTKFEELLSRQSRTYAAADAEYQRRYGIEPPPGFEAWYDFAVANQSPLIDEFDTIYHSVSPFWRLSSTKILEAMNGVQATQGSETWRCQFSSANAKTRCSHRNRVYDRNVQTLFNKLSVMPGVSIPEVEFLVNHFDEPRVIFPAPSVEHEGLIAMKNLKHRTTWDMLTQQCPLAQRDQEVAYPEEYFGLPFLKNISSSRDLCRHPEYETMHGMLISPTSFPLIEGFAPVLSTGALSTMGDIMFPSPAYTEQEFLYDDSKAIEWEDKRNELYWAGATTGGFSKAIEWHHFHRQRFVTFVQNLERRSFFYLKESEGKISRTTSFLTKHLFNVAFTKINQCSVAACIAQFASFKPAPRADAHRPMESRLVFDLDGNGISGRFYRLLASNSLPLKQTLLREWHDDRIVPWVHYIPVSLGMEELPETVNWLTGNARGQEKAKEIAEKGREWFGRALREVDMTIYIYRLLLELARLQDPEREARIDQIYPAQKMFIADG